MKKSLYVLFSVSILTVIIFRMSISAYSTKLDVEKVYSNASWFISVVQIETVVQLGFPSSIALPELTAEAGDNPETEEDGKKSEPDSDGIDIEEAETTFDEESDLNENTGSGEDAVPETDFGEADIEEAESKSDEESDLNEDINPGEDDIDESVAASDEESELNEEVNPSGDVKLEDDSDEAIGLDIKPDMM